MQREIFARQRQSDFRESLIRAYRGQCAVTGCTVLPVLETAHLRPYRGAHTNLVTNGLLLRADIHTLLDYKLWAPEPGTRAIAISRLLIGTPYNELSGRKIVEPATLALRPAESVLEKSGGSSARPRRRGSSTLGHDSTPTAEMHDRCRTPRG